MKFWLWVGLNSEPILPFVTQPPKMFILADFFSFVKNMHKIEKLLHGQTYFKIGPKKAQ